MPAQAHLDVDRIGADGGKELGYDRVCGVKGTLHGEQAQTVGRFDRAAGANGMTLRKVAMRFFARCIWPPARRYSPAL